MNQLSSNIKPLADLNAQKNPGYWGEETNGQAPHKPFLLLSVLDGIELGWITSNQVELSRELIDTFYTYWNAIIGEDQNTTIALPFYHMKSESFWELVYQQDEKEYKNSPSLGGLKTRLKYAMIDPALYDMMDTDNGREEIRRLLIGSYFSESTAKKLYEICNMNREAWEYSGEVEEMAAEPFVAYRKDKKKRRKVSRYVQVREAGFSLAVRKNYKYSCAVCRNRVVTPGGETLVEGAHIIPWSKSNNDDPRNGLSLCRTHHWMFDKMMLTIRTDYSVQLSKWLSRDKNRAEETMRLKDAEILLPGRFDFYPSAEALEHHNERFESYHKEN